MTARVDSTEEDEFEYSYSYELVPQPGDMAAAAAAAAQEAMAQAQVAQPPAPAPAAIAPPPAAIAPPPPPQQRPQEPPRQPRAAVQPQEPPQIQIVESPPGVVQEDDEAALEDAFAALGEQLAVQEETEQKQQQQQEQDQQQQQQQQQQQRGGGGRASLAAMGGRRASHASSRLGRRRRSTAGGDGSMPVEVAILDVILFDQRSGIFREAHELGIAGRDVRRPSNAQPGRRSGGYGVLAHDDEDAPRELSLSERVFVHLHGLGSFKDIATSKERSIAKSAFLGAIDLVVEDRLMREPNALLNVHLVRTLLMARCFWRPVTAQQKKLCDMVTRWIPGTDRLMKTWACYDPTFGRSVICVLTDKAIYVAPYESNAFKEGQRQVYPLGAVAGIQRGDVHLTSDKNSPILAGVRIHLQSGDAPLPDQFLTKHFPKQSLTLQAVTEVQSNVLEQSLAFKGMSLQQQNHERLKFVSLADEIAQTTHIAVVATRPGGFVPEVKHSKLVTTPVRVSRWKMLLVVGGIIIVTLITAIILAV